MGDNKILVAWAHFPIGLGVLVPIIVWFMNKDKDKKAAFQAKQALVWQVLGTVLILGIMLVGGAITFATFGSGMEGILYVLFPLLALGLGGIFALFALLGAIKNFQGKDFKYPIIGAML